MISSIKDPEITFVVQGPVQLVDPRTKIEGVTASCLNSIRQYFPNSQIILSTWKDQNLTGLDFDLLLELDDPGPNKIYVNGDEQILNNNRQLYSSHQGLTKVRTKYAVKMRSDNLITGRGFLNLFEKYIAFPRRSDFSFLKARIVTTSTFFILSHYGNPVFFHKSDLFDFGLTEDLLKIWPDKLIGNLSFSPNKEYKSRSPSTEQFLCLNWLSSLVDKKLEINNKTNDHAGLGKDFWNRFLANNIISDLPENLGLDVTKKFYHRGNLALEYDLYDWKNFSDLEKCTIDLKRIKRLYKIISGKLLRKTIGLFS